MTAESKSSVDVAIVGGGPAGLSAALALHQLGITNVVVLERETQAGGVPRHTEHLGYGIRDLHRVTTGPRYAAELRERVETAGITVRTATTAVDWLDDTTLQIADATGLSTIAARSVVLATGVRERPRAARLVAGDRGAGIFTTGSLQQLTANHHQRPGTRAVIVGAEHVSFSAVLTLRHAGCDAVAMVTPLPRHQSYPALRAATASRYRVPIITSANIAEIHGRNRVEAVTLTNGQRIECDTVVFTGDWIPDNELARRGGIATDAASRSPIVDGSWRTNRRGVFAIGNLIHPAETADICALDGRNVANAVAGFMATNNWPTDPLRIMVENPIAWISPGAVQPRAAAALKHFTLRVSKPVADATICVTQNGTVLWRSRRRRRLVPNRSISISATWLTKVDPAGSDINVTLNVAVAETAPQRLR